MGSCSQYLGLQSKVQAIAFFELFIFTIPALAPGGKIVLDKTI